MASEAVRDDSLRVICAWCGAVVNEGQPGGLVSHGMCSKCVAETWNLETEEVLSMTAAQADRLPWGIIRLRGDGEVVLYNVAESKLSGRPIELVVGKNFFREVAPCTRVREFEGRQAARRAAGESGVDEFEFVFQFPGDAMVVSIRMIYSAATDTTALQVRREG
jgi:photoactive yellow protein